LMAALDAYIVGDRTIANCHRSHPKPRRRRAATAPKGQPSLEIETSMATRDLATLASRWVEGAEFDWTRLYVAGRPRRTRVPTYPFARERYWVAAKSLAIGGVG